MKENADVIHSAHDLFFRQAMTYPQVAREFFETYLPIEVQKIINFDTLKLCKESYLDEKLRVTITDLLFSVEFSGMPGYIYLLEEHKSRPEKELPYLIWKRIIRILDDHQKKNPKGKLPIIYPLIFYTGEKKYNYSTSLFDLFEFPELAKEIFIKPFPLIDLHRISNEELKKRTWLGILGLSMKVKYERELLEQVRDMLSLARKILGGPGNSYIESALNYLMGRGDIKDKEALANIVETELTSKLGGKNMVTIAEYYGNIGRQEGMEQGIQKGKEEGRMEGQIEVIRRLLASGMVLETVSKVTGFSIKELRKYLADVYPH